LPRAVHVDPDLNDPDQLHEIDSGLSMPVRVQEDRVGRGRGIPSPEDDVAVAVLVEAAPARGERDRLAGAPVERQRAERPETKPDGVDTDGGDALRRQRGRKEEGSPLLGARSAVCATAAEPPNTWC